MKKITIEDIKNPYKMVMFRGKVVKPDGPFLFRFKRDGKMYEIPCYVIVGFVNDRFVIHVPSIELENGERLGESFYLAKETTVGVFVSHGKGYYY